MVCRCVLLQTMHSDQSKEEVGVVVRNSAGRTEIALCPVAAEAGSGREQKHLAARRRMEALGYETLIVFDNADPAFAVLVTGRKYKQFFDDAVVSLQDAIVPNRPCSGADMVDWVGEVFGRHAAGEEVYIAASADGYWSNRDGWSGDASEATLERDPAQLSQLQCAGALVILELRLDALDDMQELPSIDDLEAYAGDAIERAQKHGFAINENNAAEVLAEEMRLAGQTVPAVAQPLLGAYMLHAQRVARAETENVRPCERG